MQLDRGYVTLEREWQPGEIIELDLPMPVRWVEANKRVQADRGKIALQRGPLVYCVEWLDNPDERLRDLRLPDPGFNSSSLESLRAESVPDLLGGVVVIRGRALYPPRPGSRPSYIESDFAAIPYYAWANRGPGEMAVWLHLNAHSPS
jgi:DUF1680 family protein